LDKNQQEISTLFLQQNQLQQQNLEQVKYYQNEGLQMAESIINAAQRSYKAGDIGYIEYIQSIKDAIKLKTDYLVVLNNYNQTIIQLNYLLNR
jgi:cobalt-zinc-cadmium resistance protein CzcA